VPLHPRHIKKHHSFASILDTRRERFGDFEQRFLGRALALAVAAAGDQLRHERARLGEREAGADSFRPRAPRRRYDVRVVAVSFDDGHRLLAKLRLAAQPRREREHRNEKTGEADHDGTADRRPRTADVRASEAVLSPVEVLSPES
jgi:hypothetical protein